MGVISIRSWNVALLVLAWIQHHKHRKISDISSVADNHTISLSLNRYLFSVSYGDRIERYGDVEFHL